MPLIVKGARQIGKTEAIRHFALGNYKSFIEINEEELLQILNREPINKNLKTQEIKNVFRF